MLRRAGSQAAGSLLCRLAAASADLLRLPAAARPRDHGCCGHVRLLSAAATGADGTGPGGPVDAAIFEVDGLEAERLLAQHGWAALSVPAARPSPTNPLRPELLPFYCFDVVLDAEYTGEVYRTSVSARYNSSTRSFQPVVTRVRVPIGRSYTAHLGFSSREATTQVYASYDLHRELVNQAAPADFGGLLMPLARAIARSAPRTGPSGGPITARPFAMHPAAAFESYVLPAVEQRVKAYAKQRLSELHGDVADITLSLIVRQATPRRLRLPAYVLRYVHRGENYHALVGGLTGAVGADWHLSALRVGGAVAGGLTVAAAIVTMGGASAGHVPQASELLVTWLWDVLLPAGLAAAYAVGSPHLTARARQARRAFEAARDAETAARAASREQSARSWAGASWAAWAEQILRQANVRWSANPFSAEWPFGSSQQQQHRRAEQAESARREYEQRAQRERAAGGGDGRQWEQWQRQWQEQARQQRGSRYQQQRPQQQAPPGPRSDRLGYYQLLGVEPTASLDEIKRAYLAAAKRTHPDTAASGSRQATGEDFKKVQAAYSVLRDAGKRALYDATGAG